MEQKPKTKTRSFVRKFVKFACDIADGIDISYSNVNGNHSVDATLKNGTRINMNASNDAKTIDVQSVRRELK